MKGDDIIREMSRLKRGQGAMLGNQLLLEIERGYPASNLERLLFGENEWAAGEAAWVLAETGERASAVLQDLPRLLAHTNDRVRYWTVDFVLQCASANEMCLGLQLLEDGSEIVRSYAIRQFAKLPMSMLTRMLGEAEATSSQQRCACVVKTLQASSQEEVLKGMENRDVGLRSAALSAALRAGPLSDAVVERALQSGDAALERIAKQANASA